MKQNLTYNAFVSKNAELESRIQHLEEEIKREENEGQEILKGKVEQISYMKSQIENITINYDELMANLEAEINTYKNLLEGFESADEKQ